MLQKTFISLLLFLFTALPYLSAQSNSSTATELSLNQAVQYALQNHVDVLNAKDDEIIAKKDVKEVIGIGLPQVKGTADLQHFFEIPTQFLPDFVTPSVYDVLIDEGLLSNNNSGPSEVFPAQFGTPYTASAGVEASQLLFDGSYLIGLKATKTYQDVSKKTTEQVKIEKVINVSKAYYNVLVSEERMGIIIANETRLKSLFDETKALYENGFVEKLDVDRIELSYNDVVFEKEKVQNLLNLSLLVLKFEMGMNLKEEIQLTDKLSDIQFTPTLPVQDNFNYQNRVEYSIMETQNRLLELEVKRNQVDYFPNLVAFGSYSTNAQRNEFDIFEKGEWFPTGIVGARLQLNIFDGFQRNAKIQKAKINHQKMERAFDLMENSIDLQIESARTNFENAVKSLQIQEKNKALAEEVVRVTKIKYEEGLGTNLEVTNAESSLKEAQSNYYNALFDAIVAKLDYEQATGSVVIP
ncbi:MAG: TolC family protein [Bacteroidia bacterium]|nr:TolC family protein [Bacteroidia bacterium]